VKTKSVAAYYRISQARDGMKAPELYEDEIRRYCAYRNLELGEIFSDLDHSGYRNSEKRPALNELVRRRHEFSGVVVPKLSRFGRSLKHLTQLFDTFDSDGIALIFLDLGLDTSTSQGRLLRNVMAAFAEYEPDVRGDYTRANARRMISQGLPFGAHAPFGYLREGKSYALDPVHADEVRLIFARHAAGVSQSAIARELFQRGIRTAKGNVWKANKVGRLLDNPAYAGLLRLDGEFIKARWEPLVDPEVWNAVAARRRETREQWSRGRHPKRLLAGLIYCDDCGRRAYFTARGGDLPGRYRCAHTDPTQTCGAGGVNAARAENYVTAAFLERARYYLLRGAAGSFIAQRQWEVADGGERRMLLHAVIDRVVILPLEPGQQHPGRAGRRLSIDWKAAPTPVAPAHVNRHTQGTGRGVSFAREQLAAAKAETSTRSGQRCVLAELGPRTRSGRHSEWSDLSMQTPRHRARFAVAFLWDEGGPKNPRGTCDRRDRANRACLERREEDRRPTRRCFCARYRRQMGPARPPEREVAPCRADAPTVAEGVAEGLVVDQLYLRSQGRAQAKRRAGLDRDLTEGESSGADGGRYIRRDALDRPSTRAAPQRQDPQGSVRAPSVGKAILGIRLVVHNSYP
jgi:DNA invertase Pin-like site-specific DNA recombinase